MLARTLAFVTGIYCLLQFSYLPNYWVVILLPVFLALHFYFKSFNIPFFYILGFCYALLRVGFDLDQSLDSFLEGRELTLKGVISSLPESYDDNIKFLLHVDEIVDGEMQLTTSKLVRLNWYKTKQTPVPGETWQLQVKLKRPYGFMNSGGFDYEFLMLRKGITATGYVKKSELNQKLVTSKGHYFDRLRFNLKQKIESLVDKPLLGLVLALSIGDRSKLDVKQWQVFTQTGTNHLIAISGLHLGLIAGFIYFLTRTLWRRFYCLTQLAAAPVMASIVAFVAAFFYAGLAGFALPTQRALIMIGVFLLGLFSARQIISSHAICVAVILVLLLDPYSLVAVDFWLSFMAVVLILYITRFRISKQSNLSKWLYLQCLLSLALFPLIIFWFKQIPLYSVLANIVAIPVVGFFIVPLVLLAMISLFPSYRLSEYLYTLVGKMHEIHWSYLEFLSRQDYAVIPVAGSNVGALVLALLGVFILLIPKGLPKRWLGILFLLPLLFPISPKLAQGEFKLTQLDVGQGLSAVIQTREHTLVYDTGAQFSQRFNIGDAVLLPYLREKGINQLSMLIISHGDNDHVGGADALISKIKTKKVLSSVPERFLSSTSQHCYAGQKWTWDGVKFEVIHPELNDIFTGNNASCVLKVSSLFGSVLLTGDIEKEAEKILLVGASDKINADILMVPHHGSKTSSSIAFIKAVGPKYAFISAGYRNRFGFPKQDIMSRYEANGVETLLSYETGELSVDFVKSGLKIEQFRSKNRRFWHH